jgi:hypothetical protein
MSGKCHVCGDATDLCCSDCQISLALTVYVCRKPECRDRHEEGIIDHAETTKRGRQ